MATNPTNIPAADPADQPPTTVLCGEPGCEIPLARHPYCRCDGCGGYYCALHRYQGMGADGVVRTLCAECRDQ